MPTLLRGLLFIGITLAAAPGFSQSNPLVGCWRLIAADKILPDGMQVTDYGPSPHGIAIFTGNGYYVLEVFRADHMKFASGDRAKGTPEEYKQAILSTSCHFGTYSLDMAHSTITLNIDRASFPNWDGSSRVSPLILQSDTLTWRSPTRPDGSTPMSVFVRMK
jgi:hypothetical protein